MHEYHFTTVVHLTGGYPQARYWAVVTALMERLSAVFEEAPLDAMAPLPPKMSIIVDMQQAVRIQHQAKEMI